MEDVDEPPAADAEAPPAPNKEKTPHGKYGSKKSSPKKNDSDGSDDDEPHFVTFTITVAVAYPKPVDEHSRLMEELMKRNKRTVDAPRPQQFLHSDYLVAPKHERTVTDVVTYSVAAKVFTENESKVVKTWDDGDLIWVAWMHSHEIEVNTRNVVALFNHTIDMKIWDAKEKLSVKARTDRPKAFRLPSATDAPFPGRGVQAVVSKQSLSWQNVQPRDSVTDLAAAKKDKGMASASQTIANRTLEEKAKEAAKPTETEEREKPALRVRSSLGRLAGVDASEEEKKRINDLKRQQAKLQRELARNRRASIAADKSIKRAGIIKATPALFDDNEEGRQSAISKKQKLQDAARTSDSTTRIKAATVAVNLELLFSGTKVLTSRIKEPVGAIRDALVTVSLDGKLLPDYLERLLNPLVINLKSVKDMPETPVPYPQLSRTCAPVYCKYSFLGHPYHITDGRPHGRHVYFEDIHVVLLGRLDEGELREYIQSQSLQIDVHDRDKTVEDNQGRPALFGEERFDTSLANVGIVSAKKTTFNPFQSKKKAFDPFGVATVSLIDILRGQTALNIETSVLPCSMPDANRDPTNMDDDTRLMGVAGAVDRPVRAPQLAGHYIQAGTTLKVKVTLRFPFVPSSNVPRLLPTKEQMCPFSRVIYYFSYENKQLLKRIEDFVTRRNGVALNLDRFEKQLMESALSTYKLTIEQKRSKTLDIVTGFHVIDGKLHLLVLEGLREHAMKELLREIPHSEPQGGETLVHLYDTSMTFSSRLYAGLDVDLCRVRLHQSIGEILQQPLLYVRDMVPKPCLDCVTKVHEITKLKRLRDVAYSNLFPTSEMVISMSREFGVPLTFDDFETHHENVDDLPKPSAGAQVNRTPVEVSSVAPKRQWTPMDNSNEDYLNYLEQKKDEDVPNYVTNNIIAVQEAGKRRRPLHPTVRSLTADVPAHNYSSQSLNSTELGKDILRGILADKDPSGRYTYHPAYNSAMLVPVNVDAFYRAQDEAAKAAWRTGDGFVYPGVRSSRACNEHTLKPNDSRIEELRLCFRDNVLHRNILQPTLSRDRMTWENRSKDIELYRRPASKFEDAPVTIHLAGQLRSDEELSHKREEMERWRSRVVVEDPTMRFHRVLAATEQSNASNQLDRLTNLLKDEPRKLSLRRQPAPEIPPLSVVLNPSVDTVARAKGVKLPPAFDESREANVGFMPGPFDDTSWAIDSNRIHIKDEEHRKFAQMHGRDINLIHKERTLLSKHVKIKPLFQHEMDNHLFRIPPIPDAEKDAEDKIAQHEKPDLFSGKSEYRYKFAPYEAAERLREIYPRHTFAGFAAPVGDDGKSVARDASLHLLPLTKEEAARDTSDKTDTQRQTFGSEAPGDASVEIAKQPVLVS